MDALGAGNVRRVQPAIAEDGAATGEHHEGQRGERCSRETPLHGSLHPRSTNSRGTSHHIQRTPSVARAVDFGTIGHSRAQKDAQKRT
jgi:hypothetical protein